MAQLLFIAIESELDRLQEDDNPIDSFTCMNGQGIDQEMRAQLYSVITGSFLDDCLSLEDPVKQLSAEGPWITRLPSALTQQIASLEDHELTEVAHNWSECSEMETADLSLDDLLDYLYILANLCHNCTREPDLHIYTFTV